MKLADLAAQSGGKTAPSRSKVLWSLIGGSIALHFVLLWAVAHFPGPPAKAPEKLTEVELRDFPVAPPPKPVAVVRPVSPPNAPVRIAKIARPRRVETAPRQIERPRIVTPPRLRRVRRVVVTAPLVRSTKVVSKTGIIAKTVVKKTVATQPTFPTARRPQRETPQKTDSILPQAPVDYPSKIPAPKSADRSAQGTGNGKGSGDGSGTGSGQGSGQGSGKGSGTGSGTGSGIGSGAGAGQGSGVGNGQGAGSGNGTGQGSGAGSGSGDGNGSGGGSGGGGGGGGGGNGGGGPFGVGGATGEGPRHIVYVLDISTSMEFRIERAKQELRDALDGLQPGESFNIVAFYGKFRLFNRDLVDATPKNIAKGKVFIDDLRLSSGTNLQRAFEKAFAARDVNVMVVITDGVPTYGIGSPKFKNGMPVDGSANFDKLTGLVRGLNRSGARIYTVGLIGKNPDGTDDSFEASALLERIATDSGGQFKTVRIDAPQQPDFP